MARTLGVSLEPVVETPAAAVRPVLPVPRPVRRGMELDAAVLEAVAVVLLQNCTPRLVVREAEASREARVHQLERRLAERGGWDEV